MGLIVLGISFFVSSNAYASYNWKDYFSTNQVTAIKKGTSQSIINKFKTDSDWKDVISGRNIKDNAITSEKIKDGTITGSDLASNIDITTTENGRFDDVTVDGDLALLGGGTFSVDGNSVLNGNLTLDSSESSHAVDFSGASSMTIPRGNGAPASGDCDGADKIGRMYINTASGGNLYVCTNKQGSVGWDTVNLTD